MNPFRHIPCKFFAALAAAGLTAVLAAGCAVGPDATLTQRPGFNQGIPPPPRNYLQRFTSLKSDKDRGVLYWVTYGH
jgi:hypothetical protein